jgi:hypothetical protein
MRVGRVVWSSLAPVVGLVIALALPAGTRAQDPVAPGQAADAGAPAAASPVKSDHSFLEQLLSGPSLHETGRVGSAHSADSRAIEPVLSRDLGVEDEKSVRAVEESLENPASGPSGVIDGKTLDREIERRFAVLQSCRDNVARAKHVTPGDVVGSRLTLRWTIQPTGSVGSTVVVATSPADSDLMACVKTTMGAWRFTRPTGGPVRVEREFAFHALAPRGATPQP